MPSDKSPAPSVFACFLGFWSAALLTLSGVVYLAVVSVYFALHGLALPPVGAIQIFGGVITILDAQILLVLMAGIYEAAPARLRILSLLAVLFTVLFDAMVSINRFVQLSVVRQRLSSGDAEGINWFLAYGPHSAMFALEILGWGFFLGLASLCAAPVFSRGKLEVAIRWLFALYGVLGLVTAAGFVLASPISAVGFLAWGLVLPIATALLMVFFRRGGQNTISR